MPHVLRDPGKNSPAITQSGVQAIQPAQLASSQPYKYDYPDGLDWRPGSPLHEKMKTILMDKAQASREVMQSRYPGWKEIDRTLTAYIDLTQHEDDVKKENENKPVSIVVPVSYATIETLLTYWVAAFLEEPYFRYEGTGPEDQVGAIMMEMLVAQQCRQAKVGLAMHTMWRDSLAYGFGATHIGWEVKTAYRTKIVEETMLSKMMNAFVGTGETKEQRERVNVFEGSTLTALDPYQCLPDPDTPIQDVQNSEFWGWIARKSLMVWMAMERDNPEYFNFKYCKHFDSRSNMMLKNSGRQDKNGTSETRSGVNQPTDVLWMYVRLIPKDYGLGDEEYPEIWLFGLAGDEVIVRAQPLGLDHNQIPVAVSAPDYDGHSITPISRLETVHGLQTTLDWMLNSHIANVRKAINDMLIVDPQLVNIHDVANPKPGKIIRMRRQAWGRGVKDAVMQLAVTDVTQGHVGDTAILTQMIREATGSQDAVSGIRRKTSERVSATEAQGTMQSALSRLEKSAKITSLQAHYDIAYQMAWNTRQLMDSATYAKITGDWANVLIEEHGMTPDKGRIAVDPKQLDVNFDVVPHDGSVPSAGDGQTMLTLYQIASQNPVIAQSLDMVRIFKHIARLSGAKNINDFVKKGGNINANVIADEQVAQQEQAGNMVPVEQMQ